MVRRLIHNVHTYLLLPISTTVPLSNHPGLAFLAIKGSVLVFYPYHTVFFFVDDVPRDATQHRLARQDAQIVTMRIGNRDGQILSTCLPLHCAPASLIFLSYCKRRRWCSTSAHLSGLPGPLGTQRRCHRLSSGPGTRCYPLSTIVYPLLSSTPHRRRSLATSLAHTSPHHFLSKVKPSRRVTSQMSGKTNK